MVDPVSLTFGAFVTGLLVKAAESAAGEMAKDAYKTCRDWLKAKAGGGLAQLEEKPQSKPRQEALAETIDALPAADQATLRDLAKAMAEKLNAERPGTVPAYDIGVLEGFNITLGGEATGGGQIARIKKVKAKGDVVLNPKVGGSSQGKG